MSITELDPQRRALEEAREAEGIPRDGNVEGRSIAERAAEGAEEPWNEQEPEELFVLEQGRRVTVSQLVARGTPIEYRATLNAKSVKGGNDMGLLSYKDPHITLAVSARQGDVRHSPTYNEDGEVTKVTVYVNFKPQSIHDATSPEGRALLGLEE